MTIGGWLLHRIRRWTGKRSQGFVMIFESFGGANSLANFNIDTKKKASCRPQSSFPTSIVFHCSSGKQNSKGRHVFLFDVDLIFAQKLRSPMTKWQQTLRSAKFNFYLRKRGSIEQHATLHICCRFSRSNRVWIFWPVNHWVYHILWSSTRVFSWSAWTSAQVSQAQNFVSIFRYIGKFGLLCLILQY